MVDTTIYENMEVVFIRTYNFQNQVRNLAEMIETDTIEENIKMETIKRILELGVSMKEVIQQVSFNKEFLLSVIIYQSGHLKVNFLNPNLFIKNTNCVIYPISDYNHKYVFTKNSFKNFNQKM